MDFLTPLGPGDRLGAYTLIRRLGVGGMGVVFEAIHDSGGRPAAVKVLSSWLIGELGRARFEREVQAIASLSHPHTVRIYDFGELPDGTLYYAMEYLDGWDLKQLVDLDGRQSPARTLRILDQVAGALGEAHERGLLHRDIKPPNIILCGADGAPDVAKLVDFGLVVPLRTTPSARITLDGEVIGTPRYVAPELLGAGDALSPATDFYALGLVAYFLLSGHHAFEGLSPAEILTKQRRQPPPPLSSLVPGLRTDIKSVVEWCLEKQPSNRPQSSRELREAFKECADAERWEADAAREWWDAWRDRPQEDPAAPELRMSQFGSRRAEEPETTER